MEDWLREAKNSPDALKIGMFLIHNGVVRQSPKAKVRQGIDDGSSVKGMEFTYNQEKVNVAIKETLKMDGIFYTKVWLNEGQLELGDDIMYILIGCLLYTSRCV